MSHTLPPATLQPQKVYQEPVPPSVAASRTVGNPWKPNVAEREWRHIVIHHTGTTRGDVASIHQAHLKRKDKHGNSWLGIGYHFVIGNGKGMGDGEIEPTFRWNQQLQGAHAGVNEYNQYGIGIALIGNFDESAPSSAQLNAVENLVAALSQAYGIREDQIIGHSDIKATACPGKYFPLEELRQNVFLSYSVGQQLEPSLLRFAGTQGRQHL